MLALHYSSDGISLNAIVETILKNGFDVQDDDTETGTRRSLNVASNPGNTKTAK